MEVEYPFAFPVVARYDDGTVMVYRTGAAAGLCREEDARSGRVPKVEFYDGAGRAWRPRRIAAVSPEGKRIFGQALVHVTRKPLDDDRSGRAAPEPHPDYYEGQDPRNIIEGLLPQFVS